MHTDLVQHAIAILICLHQLVALIRLNAIILHGSISSLKVLIVLLLLVCGLLLDLLSCLSCHVQAWATCTQEQVCVVRQQGAPFCTPQVSTAAERWPQLEIDLVCTCCMRAEDEYRVETHTQLYTMEVGFMRVIHGLLHCPMRGRCL